MAERKAKKITIDEFRDLMMKKTKASDFYEASYKIFDNAKIEKDLSKVIFSLENCTYKTGEFGVNAELGFKTINGLTFLLFCAGGDWEEPLVFALYVDPNDNFRAYIPSEGNVYNHKLKCAYGSESFIEDFEEGNQFDYENPSDPDNPPIFDNNKMLADICTRIILID